MMVQSKVGNVPAVHGATLSSSLQSRVADSHHASRGRRDSFPVSGSWWYELYVHSPHDLLSVQDSFEDHHVGSPLTLLGAGWHPPDAVPQRGDVDPPPPSEMLHRKSFKLIQVLPTDGANYKDTICSNPK